MKKTKSTDLHPLQKLSLFGIVITVGISVLLGNIGENLQRYTKDLTSNILPSAIIELTNIERKETDVPTLKRDPVLDKAAKLKAEHMRDKEYFSHFSPKENISPWHWFEVAGYEYIHAGENLAIYFNDSKEVVEAWMKSPLHRENIMDKSYTEIGVAAVEGSYKGYETYYVVQLFGYPANKDVIAKNRHVEKNKEHISKEETSKDTKENTIESSQEKTDKKEEVKESESESEENIPITVTPSITSKDGSLIFTSQHLETKNPIFAGIKKDSTEIKGLVDRTPGGTFTFEVLYTILTISISLLILISIFISIRKEEYPRIIYGSTLLMLLILATYTHIYFISI